MAGELYTHFFITKGRGISATSRLNAFDKALVDAGIAQCNLISVSSILPCGCTRLNERPVLQPGRITHCVMARKDGKLGESIAAGIGYTFYEDYGLVAESHGTMTASEMKEVLRQRLEEMAEVRNFKGGETTYEIEAMENITSEYGCVIVALVYV
jgi:arginine decarboxylase